MRNIKIFTLVGGISRNSLNQKLFGAFKEHTPSGFELTTFDISKLPFFSQDLEMDPPDIVTEFKEHIREADAHLFVTPEYNRTIPGVLTNALAWGSRPYGQNLWAKKPAGVVGASIGNIGTFGAQHHLRQSLAYLDLWLIGQPEFYCNASKSFDEKGKLIDERLQGFIQDYWKAFQEWIERHVIREEVTTGTFKAQGQEDSPFAH